MKKIFAKELAALAVLALAFTGCNTAFDGTNANLSEKESEYTDRSGATQSVNDAGSVTVPGAAYISHTNKKNVIAVTITSFSKINISSADEAIHFQNLSNNTTTGYYKVRGSDLPKTRINVNENAGTTVITYEVDGTGVTTDTIAFFVDATKLKTKGGTPVLAGDGNLTRGEVSDSIVSYISASGTTAITGANENFAPSYSPIGAFGTPTALTNAEGKLTGAYRIEATARNRRNTFVAGSADEWESGLKAQLDKNVILQVRDPKKREFETKPLTFTYHDAASTAATDPYGAHTYTADFGPFEPGTEYRIIQTLPEGLTAPAWYKDVVGHEGSVYFGNRAGAKSKVYPTGATTWSVTYLAKASVPSYISVGLTAVTSGTDLTSSYNQYTDTNNKLAIQTAQREILRATPVDNWFEVTTLGTAELSPTACSDFIVVDDNNKKIDSEVQVIKFENAGANSGKVRLVKILLKSDTYRNGDSSVTNKLHVCVGKGTQLVENKTYPAQKSFGYWEDVVDDDASGYVKLN